MTPDRWQAAGELFDEALAVPTVDRVAFVNERCATDDALRDEVVSLLESHRAVGGFLQDRIKNAVTAFSHVSNHPERVGAYRLIRELGRGGMGTVFLAERDDDEYRASVAIKLVRPGMDTEFILARFRRERQTLARLQHPNISRLFDGGSDGGLPYIVMEYIDGPPITIFAAQNAIGFDERLRLFVDVCSAVDYAHRHFVVHRDLKPGNILVGSDGVPKLVDFGICKLLNSDGLGGETISAGLTPNYASPEQIRGEPATPLSDVYSLGAVLYELLTGICPRRFQALTPVALARALDETSIALPSVAVGDRASARRLAGDLDNILLRALENEPLRRYESAAHFAEDIRRYLAHEPVRARPQTRRYRAGKFVKRHRVTVGAAAAVFVALSTGLGVSISARRLAESRLEQVRTLADRLVFDLHDAVRDLPGSTRARALIVSTGLEYLDSSSAALRGDAKAALQLAAAYRKLGDVQGGVEGSNLGATSTALTSYRRAATLLDDALNRRPDDVDLVTERVVVAHRIGAIQGYTSKLPEAVQTFAGGIRIGTRIGGNRSTALDAALAGVYLASSDAKRNLHDFDGAFRDAREAMTLSTEVVRRRESDRGAQHALANAYATIGMAEGDLGRLQQALDDLKRQVDIMTRLTQAEPHNVEWQRDLMMAFGHVADLSGNPGVANLGDRASAVRAYEQAAGIARALFEADRADQRAAADYGIILSRVETVMDDRDLAAKIAVQQQSLDVLDTAAAINPDNLQLKIYQALVAQHLGDAFRTTGDHSRAHDAYARSAAIAAPAIASGHASLAILFLQSEQRLAINAADRGRRHDALEAARRAEDVGERGDTRAKARGRAAMGFTYAALASSAVAERDDRNEAIAWMARSIEAWKMAQREPGFLAPHAREMQDAEQALASLQKR